MEGRNGQDSLGSTPQKEWNEYARLKVFISVLTNIHLFFNTTRYLLVNTEVPVEISATIFRIPEVETKDADRKLLRNVCNFQSTRLLNLGYLNLQ